MGPKKGTAQKKVVKKGTGRTVNTPETPSKMNRSMAFPSLADSIAGDAEDSMDIDDGQGKKRRRNESDDGEGEAPGPKSVKGKIDLFNAECRALNEFSPKHITSTKTLNKAFKYIEVLEKKVLQNDDILSLVDDGVDSLRDEVQGLRADVDNLHGAMESTEEVIEQLKHTLEAEINEQVRRIVMQVLNNTNINSDSTATTVQAVKGSNNPSSTTHAEPAEAAADGKETEEQDEQKGKDDVGGDGTIDAAAAEEDAN